MLTRNERASIGRDYGIVENVLVDLCDGALEATRRAGEASDKANQSGDADDYQAAMLEHERAEKSHDEAADERTGHAATVHSQFARDHHAVADQHRATRDFMVDQDMQSPDDSGEDETTTQNRRSKVSNRTNRQLVSNAATETEATLRYYRSQGITGAVYAELAQRLRDRQAPRHRQLLVRNGVIPSSVGG